MCAFRRVEGAQAGAAALGVLVPPGRRTFLILRPRSLPWDLLLLSKVEGSEFRQMGRDEAAAAARDLHRALEGWSAGGSGAVETVGVPEGGSWLRVRVGPFALLACARAPGQPYRPHVFADSVRAHAAADDLAPILRPPAGVEQELYFNTHHFTR